MPKIKNQGSLFPDFTSDDPEAVALLKLLYFFKRSFDQVAISLCVSHFQPLDLLFQLSKNELKNFFMNHRHIGGYIASTFLTDPTYLKKASKYAEKQLNLLSSKTPGELILRTHSRFPKSLLRSSFPIDWIFAYPKKIENLRSPIVAIIGSRRSSPKQLESAKNIAEYVSGEGGTVVTGLASGADTAAYQGARSHPTSIIGVIGTGIKKMYPNSNRLILDELLNNGGYLLTEFPSNFSGNSTSFILRNRIIASLSDLVIAVSGNYASGTAHTIRFAHDMGVSIMSVGADIKNGISTLVTELGGKDMDILSVKQHIKKLGK